MQLGLVNVDVEKTVQFILEHQAKHEVRLAEYDVRMAEHAARMADHAIRLAEIDERLKTLADNQIIQGQMLARLDTKVEETVDIVRSLAERIDRFVAALGNGQKPAN